MKALIGIGKELFDEERIRELMASDRSARDDVMRYQIFIGHFLDWYPRVAQLLDGWHQDGTAWTEWDESVRNELRDLGIAAEMFPKLKRSGE